MNKHYPLNFAETLRIWDFSYFYSSALYFNYQTKLCHVITIPLIEISRVWGKADMGETKAFCLHNTLSHHTSETPVSTVVLVRKNKNSVRPAELSSCSLSLLLLYVMKAARQGKALTGHILVLIGAAPQPRKKHTTWPTTLLETQTYHCIGRLHVSV